MHDGAGVAQMTQARIRDVADFQNRWEEFRPLALAALRQRGLAPTEADLLGWMIEVMDRIGPRDLG